MSRPTFTASDVARYVFCNLAWAYDNLGAPKKSPAELAAQIEALRGTAARTPQEEAELRYLERLVATDKKRAAGEVYHSRVYTRATTVGTRRTRLFVWVAVTVLVLFMILWFLLAA